MGWENAAGVDAVATGVLLDERAESHGVIESGQVGRIVEHLGYRVAGQRAPLQLEHDQPAVGIDTKEIKSSTIRRNLPANQCQAIHQQVR